MRPARLVASSHPHLIRLSADNHWKAQRGRKSLAGMGQGAAVRVTLVQGTPEQRCPGMGRGPCPGGTFAQCAPCAIVETGACQRPKAARSALFRAGAGRSRLRS